MRCWRLCLTRAESTPAEGTGQPSTSAGWRVPHEWAVRAVMGCGDWRRCGAPGLARTSYRCMLPGRLKTLRASTPPSCMAAGTLTRGRGADPGHFGRPSFARSLAVGVDDRRGWACAADSWPRRGSWAGPGPQVLGSCHLTHELSWLRPKGQGERGPAWDGGSPQMDCASERRLAVRRWRCTTPRLRPRAY